MSVAAADSETAWIFRGDPKEWQLDRFVRDVRDGRVDATTGWIVEHHTERMAVDQRVFLWTIGDDRTAGIVALARIAGLPEARTEDRQDYRRAGAQEKFSGEQLRVVLEVETVLPKTLFRVKLEWDPELKGMAFLDSTDEEVIVPLGSAEAAILEDRCLKVKARPRGGKSSSSS